jgi:hypothetical protein
MALYMAKLFLAAGIVCFLVAIGYSIHPVNRTNEAFMAIDVIFCYGRNKRFAEVAIAEGFKYGTRHDYCPIARPFMVDINWERYTWSDYLGKIAEWQPVMAMVPDYEQPDQRESMIARAHELKSLGVERVMCCPKFLGAVADIPDFCIVALSIPTNDKKYKGWLPPVSELRGRKLHLLGGSPRRVIAAIRYYRRFGIEVISVDMNQHVKAAKRGTFFNGRVWQNMGAHVLTTDEAFRKSCRAILGAVETA